jgi:catechol 2,3-dioxygenase-like lactoylglutathione lyase family enzyme
MKLRFHSIVLFVKDIERSKKFYTEVLGQEIEYDFGNNVALKNGITLWRMMPDHVISRSGKHHKTNETKAFEVYFETNNLEIVQEVIAKNHLEVLHDLMEEPWGQRTIRFYDPDNNLIEVGETLEKFVIRMARSGMKLEEISVKTTIPLPIVKKLLNIP